MRKGVVVVTSTLSPAPSFQRTGCVSLPSEGQRTDHLPVLLTMTVLWLMHGSGTGNQPMPQPTLSVAPAGPVPLITPVTRLVHAFSCGTMNVRVDPPMVALSWSPPCTTVRAPAQYTHAP